MDHSNGAATAALILNFIIFALELYSTGMNLMSSGPKIFKYYTVISNALCGVSCTCYVAAYFIGKPWAMRMAELLRYLGTTMLVFTFLVVILVLVPADLKSGINPAHYYRGGIAFVHHAVAPIISFVSFIIFEKNTSLKYSYIWVAMGITMLYTGIILYLNVKRVLVGPYVFFHVYEQTVAATVLWVVVLGVVCYALDFLTYKLGKLSLT